MRIRNRQDCGRVSVMFIASVLLIAGVGLGVIPACEKQESRDNKVQQATQGRGEPAAQPAEKNEPHVQPAAHTAAQSEPAAQPVGKSAAQRAASTNAWSKPRTDEAKDERHEMVAWQIEGRGVSDPAVLEAMRNVPRHWFVPAHLRRIAYSDRPLPIGEGQTISQPYIVALMTEALHLTPDSKVLEIGTGSGYQAAVLAEITPHVFTIEIVEPLGKRAMATFDRYGYETIKTRIGDGYAGWPDHAPFDAIIVTCAPDHVPPKLIEQLKPTGRICIPVGNEFAVQRLVVVTKTEKDALDQEELIPVRFVPMTGKAQERSQDD